MKRTILWLVLATAVVALAAAGGAKETAAQASLELSAPGQFPIVSETVTLDFFAQQDPRVENLETNRYTLYLEEKTNVRINWELVPRDGVNEARQLLYASGDYPDVFFGVNVTKDEQVLYGSQGLFIPLNELIDEHGFEVKRIFAKYPTYRNLLTAPDENLYSLFYVNECYHCSLSMKTWMHTGWLGRLGLPVPETTEDFRDVLVAFKNQDPNNNGQRDEIPLTGAIKGSWWGDPYNFIMNSFVYNDGGPRLILKDGTVEFAANKPEWREGLRYLNSLYRDGLIDPAAFTQDQAQVQRLGENPGTVIVGAMGGGWPGNWMSWGGGSNREALYDTITPLEGPAGVRYAPYYPQDPGTGSFLISSTCEYPEVAFKWGDLRLSMEESINLNYGLRPEFWDWAKSGEVGLDGKPAMWTLKQDYLAGGGTQNEAWTLYGPFNYSNEWRVGQSVPPGADMYDPAQLNMRLHIETAEKYEPYKPAEYYPSVWMDKAKAEELSQIATQIRNHVEESTVRFIVGDLDIESGWSTYLKELDSMKLARYLQIYQEAYDHQYK